MKISKESWHHEMCDPDYCETAHCETHNLTYQVCQTAKWSQAEKYLGDGGDCHECVSAWRREHFNRFNEAQTLAA